MDRLTFDGNFCDIAMCRETPGGSFREDGYCSQRKCWERLKQYEDMEEQGRILVLPCKIGDTLYMIVKKPIPEKGLLRYVRRFSLTYKNLAWVLRCLGKRVFPSSEEAEAAISVMDRKAGKK